MKEKQTSNCTGLVLITSVARDGRDALRKRITDGALRNQRVSCGFSRVRHLAVLKEEGRDEQRMTIYPRGCQVKTTLLAANALKAEAQEGTSQFASPRRNIWAKNMQLLDYLKPHLKLFKILPK
jgi:hypothetical protein